MIGSATCDLRLNRHSAVGVRVLGDPRGIGIPIRIRSEWKGDDRNTKANGKWLYFKFVAGRVAAENDVPRSSRTHSTPSPAIGALGDELALEHLVGGGRRAASGAIRT